MKDRIEIGPCPSDEECVPVGDQDYEARAKEECGRFIKLIRQKLGPEPAGARLGITANPHDFGTYLEVVCHYDDAFPESVDYAFRCEAEAPRTWSDEVYIW